MTSKIIWLVAVCIWHITEEWLDWTQLVTLSIWPPKHSLYTSQKEHLTLHNNTL